ncbi:MAG: hypothetical protein H6742_07360 [Alphaproteobacteria bacterium]|nr:hypothetical protein [Alphaproteobacteria bacterium]
MAAGTEAAALVGRPAVWGRLTAVRRTLEWAAAEPARLGDVPFLGSNCTRLLQEAAALLGDESPEGLMAAITALQGADDEGEARGQAVQAACDALDALVPMGLVGMPVLDVGDPQARLVVPRRGRNQRRGRDGGRDDRRGDGPDDEAEAIGGDTTDGDDRVDDAEGDGSGPADADAPAAEGADASATDGAPEVQDPGAREASKVRTRAPRTPDDELLDLVAEAREAARRGDSQRKKGARPTIEPRLPLVHDDRGGRGLDTVEGISSDVIAALDEQGISTVGDLLLTPPADFDRRPMYREGEAPEEEVMVRGTVRSVCTRLSPGVARREVVLELRGGATVVARWMGPWPRGFSGWHEGVELALVGELTEDDTGLALYEAEPVGVDGRGSGWLATYEIDGVAERDMRDAVARSLVTIVDLLRDHMPAAIVERHRLMTIDEALRDAHFPANTTRRGRARLAFEELFLLQLGLALRGGRARPPRGIGHRALHGLVGQLDLQHNIVLDDGQERAFAEIRRDLVRKTPMARLLQGDVGAGKSMIALLSGVVVAENKAQVAFVCPDSLTAERRFLFAEPLLRSLGINPLLVNGKVGHAQADAIRRGEALIVYGTDELLQKSVEWRRLGLVVAEERDRYGTIQPEQLPGKSHRPDLLVVTTAPVPASLSFSVYGEFDVSVVPRRSGARAVPRVFSADQRAEAYELVARQLEQGHQAYVAFPAAPGRDLLGPDDARRFAQAIGKEYLSDPRIAVYSSAMSRDERFRVFDDFRHRRIDVLVSTTFIEDAPAVANATAMVVEHADKDSLIRLHRLRGHLQHGTCAFVLGDGAGEEGRRLVDLACEEADGYRLAELDLQQRGLEALLGDRAEEAPDLAWADPPQDRALLLRAREEAFELLAQDPELRRAHALGPALHSRWGDWLGEEVVPGGEGGEGKGGRKGRGGRRRRRRRRR